MCRLVIPALLAIGGAIVSSCRTPDPRANDATPPPVADEQSRRDLDLGRPATPLEPGSQNRLNLAKPGAEPARERGEDRDRSRTFEAGLDELERAFVRAIPTADHLALELPSRPSGELSRPSDLRAVVVDQFRALNEAVAFVHDRIDWLVGPTSKSVPDTESCRVWTGLDPQSSWRLRSCLVDEPSRTARRYEYILSARGADDLRGEYRVIAAGEATLEGGLAPMVRPVAMRSTPLLDSKPIVAGRIGYDFDNFHAIDGRGALGRVTIAFRVGTRARLLNISAEKYRPEPTRTELSGAWEYEAIPAFGGRATITGRADVLTSGFARGTDGKLDMCGLALSWTPEGAGRTVATACSDAACAQIRQCWDPMGEMKFENFSRAGEPPLGWSITECTPSTIELPEPPDPRDMRVREPEARDRRNFPDQSVEIPGPVALG